MRRLLLTVVILGTVAILANREVTAQQKKTTGAVQPGVVGPQPATITRPGPGTVTRPGPPGSGRYLAPTKSKPVSSSRTGGGNSTPTSSTPSTSPSSTGSSSTSPYYGGQRSYPVVYNPWAPSNGYGYGNGYPNGYSYGEPYSSYYSPYSSYGYTPYSPYGYAYGAPVFLSPWTMFGPGPIMRMMGVDSWFANPPSGGGNGGGFSGAGGGTNRVFHQPANKPDPADSVADAKPAAEHGNQHSTDLAMRYIGFGDTHFGKQKYSDAYDRYKKAAQAAPEIADAWFRQAFALSAMGRYDQAVKAVKRGVDINPDWAKSDFRLTEVYGQDDAVKQANLDSMAKASEDDQANGNVALMLGIHYYFDGKQELAKPLLERAAKVGGNDTVVQGFLGK